MYALNIDGDTAWTCYYSDFPVVRIQDGAVTGWHDTVAHGARALVVTDTHVALYGGYGPNRDVLVIAGRGEHELHPLARYRLVLPDGAPIPDTAHTIGRGADLHVINGAEWYRLDLDHAAAD